MKKAYVKPVYMAEEFTATVCVTTCNTPISQATATEITWGMNTCTNGDNGHQVGGSNGKKGSIVNYWDDVSNEGKVYVFTSSSIECDFLWNGQGTNVHGWSTDGTEEGLIWKESDRNGVNTFYDFGERLLQFFTGANADNDQHVPKIGEVIISS